MPPQTKVTTIVTYDIQHPLFHGCAYHNGVSLFAGEGVIGVAAGTVRTNFMVVRRLLGDLNCAGSIRAERGKMGGSSVVRIVLSQHLLNTQNLYKCELASVSLANIANEM